MYTYIINMFVYNGCEVHNLTWGLITYTGGGVRLRVCALRTGLVLACEQALRDAARGIPVSRRRQRHPPHLWQTARPPLSHKNCVCLVASLARFPSLSFHPPRSAIRWIFAPGLPPGWVGAAQAHNLPPRLLPLDALQLVSAFKPPVFCRRSRHSSLQYFAGSFGVEASNILQEISAFKPAVFCRRFRHSSLQYVAGGFGIQTSIFLQEVSAFAQAVPGVAPVNAAIGRRCLRHDYHAPGTKGKGLI